ncbi:DUF4118 domain-containing protein [Pseudidiomarina halophila]|uniref:histidine kinase n=1 Tax=Pseudidiomarina halophila TaxID=1449799 RepID=A0A432Y080_9GAMM|nr:DUF4118 domain-containing protein [Pseudidiomarina halophila]RUO54344.1 hypothetical protein CWI69_02705 [Pseudidiomarina halophila]
MKSRFVWSRHQLVMEFILVLAVMALTGVLAFILERWLLPSSGTALLLLLGVIGSAVLTSFRGAVFAAFIGALTFNVMFTTPRGTLHMAELDEIATLGVFIGTAMISSYWVLRDRFARSELRAAELKSQLLLSLSHDLRTPLASVVGNLTTLLDYSPRLTRTEQNELISNAIREADRLQHYLENLLQATRLEYKSVQVNKQPIAITQLMQAVIDRFDPEESPALLEIEANGVCVNAQPALLEQAIYNILDNAFRYRATETQVQVRSHYNALTNQLQLTIVNSVREDFDAKQLESWGQPFISHRIRDRGDGGLGLGIAVAYGIIAAHEGEITAELDEHQRELSVSIIFRDIATEALTAGANDS